MLPDPNVSAFSVWLLGASLGLTACAVTCMPFIGTWALARGEDGAAAWRDTLMFLGGRLMAYVLLGAIAGGVGAWFVQELASGIGNLAIGVSALASAAWLLWPTTTNMLCQRINGAHSISPFMMGGALTLIPCAPLATLLAACAAAGNAAHGAFLGGLFGFGALLTPMLVLIPACAYFGQYLLRHQGWLRPWMTGGAVVVLSVLAYARIDLVDNRLFPYIVSLIALVVGWAHLRRRRNEIVKVIHIHPR